MNALQDRLIHALTAYDRKQSTKRGYNPYALGQYFAAVDSAMERIKEGASAQAALESAFCEPLLSLCLKAIQ